MNTDRIAWQINRTFEICLPECISLLNDSVRPQAAESQRPPGEADRLSQSVFVLDDDADISRLVQHHLEAAGFTVRPYLTPANLIPDAERHARGFTCWGQFVAMLFCHQGRGESFGALILRPVEDRSAHFDQRDVQREQFVFEPETTAASTSRRRPQQLIRAVQI